MTQSDGLEYPNLTISVFLRSGYIRGAGGAADDGLFEWVEAHIRSQYPGASVSVRAAELLDGDWEIQVGELGAARLSNDVRDEMQMRLQALLSQAVERFPRSIER